jgi:hypothetical protein
MGRFERACIKLSMPGESARTLFLNQNGVGMTECERIGNGIIFLEVARTRERDRNVDLQQQAYFIECVELVVKIGVGTRRLGLARVMSFFHRHLPLSSPAQRLASRSPLRGSSMSVAAVGIRRSQAR